MGSKRYIYALDDRMCRICCITPSNWYYTHKYYYPGAYYPSREEEQYDNKKGYLASIFRTLYYTLKGDELQVQVCLGILPDPRIVLELSPDASIEEVEIIFLD